MRTVVNLARLLTLVVTLSGCPTAFTGNAHVSDGKAGCERKCKSSGLRFSSMVFMGEYSSACVCEAASAKPAPSAGAASPAPAAAAAAAATGAAVGTMEQTHAQDEQSNTPIILRE